MPHRRDRMPELWRQDRVSTAQLDPAGGNPRRDGRCPHAAARGPGRELAAQARIHLGDDSMSTLFDQIMADLNGKKALIDKAIEGMNAIQELFGDTLVIERRLDRALPSSPQPSPPAQASPAPASPPAPPTTGKAFRRKRVVSGTT